VFQRQFSNISWCLVRCSKIAEAEAAVSVNEKEVVSDGKKWLVKWCLVRDMIVCGVTCIMAGVVVSHMT
jgi:hypothetical protein